MYPSVAQASQPQIAVSTIKNRTALPRQEEWSELDLLRKTLNQIDYGLIVVEASSGRIQFANAQGRSTLHMEQQGVADELQNTGLGLRDGHIAANRPQDHETLVKILQRTRAGLRGLLSLGADGKCAPVAVIPLTPPLPGVDTAARTEFTGSTTPPSYALLVFAKQRLCDDSTVALFARERGLTSAEGQVLARVCKGMRPSQIAALHGVQISTVRTQLRSIRMKTSCETIRELVHKVSVLPPLALQISAPRIHRAEDRIRH